MPFVGSSLLAGINVESLRYHNYASNCCSHNVVSNCALVIVTTSYSKRSFALIGRNLLVQALALYSIKGYCFHYVFANSDTSWCRFNLIDSNIGNKKLCELKLRI